MHGMVGGQCADIYSEKKDVTDQQLLKDKLRFIHQHKTAALIQAALEISAIITDADETTYAQLSEYGKWIGLLFQIQDDILDETGTEEKIGKPIKSDQRNKKLTYPSLYGLKEAQCFKAKAVEKALSSLRKCSHINKQPLEQLSEYLIERTC